MQNMQETGLYHTRTHAKNMYPSRAQLYFEVSKVSVCRACKYHTVKSHPCWYTHHHK